MIDTTGAAPPATEPALFRWRWAALAVILLGEIMDMLDSLVTTIAAPTIRADLGGSAATIQWLAAGYTLAMAIGLLTGGRLGDLYGRKRMFLIGAAGFTIGSLLCGTAVSPGMLIGARLLQGLAGAMMIPQGLGMMRRMFPPKELTKAFGAFGPVMGLSSVAGPVLAGWLIDADFFGTGWRMIFLINLPLGLGAVVLGAVFLPPGREDGHGSRLDLVGALLAALGAALIVYPLVQGRELDWPAWMFVLMAASGVVFLLFARHELRRQRRGADPLITPSVFAKRGFSGGLVVGVVFFAGMTGFALTYSLYLQLGLGFSPLKAGLSQIPWSAGTVLGFPVAMAMQKRGRMALQLGALVMASGVAGLVLTLQVAGTGVGPWQLAPSLVVVGFGMGLLMAPFFEIVLASVEPHETGSAGGTLSAVQQLGSALGAAVLGTVFFGLLGGHVATSSDQDAPALRASLAAVGVAPSGQERITAGLRACGHDRSTAKDQAKNPETCVRLESDVRAEAAAHPRSAGRIAAIVRSSALHSAKTGFGAAMKITLWIVVGLLGLTFLIAFLLPPRARPEDEAEPAEETAPATA
ncbi:MFS transporter [Actinomadura harenae]|uniref:DHA2 family efflux MFS transporter permease subunit n=1 Tax=Actinomadura harenae TaxID=2483351 RepID=A0A3M2LQ35_9ACTN|nr:MFS transporter [Actinomadura harenae]RMI39571.1 DHA2 family efflux MFS transporter permease subunit [Actinomadura harenae]